MPCDTRRQVTVELKVANKDLLIQGLRSAGFKVEETKQGLVVRSKKGQIATISLSEGRVTHDQGQEQIVNEIKRAYSSAVVQHAAKRFGWNTKNVKGNSNQMILQKGRF